MQKNYDQPYIIEPKLPATASIIWLHGLGADGYDFVDLVPHLQFKHKASTRFIFPHADIQPVTINNNQPCRAWYDILSLSNMNREDINGVKQAQATLNELIHTQIQMGVTANNIILAGFSQGAAVALYTGLRFEQSLAGIIALSSYLPAADSFKEETYRSNQHTPILQIHGDHDPVLPLALAQHTMQTLQQKNYSVQWQTYPMAHQICAEEVTLIGHWLDTALAR